MKDMILRKELDEGIKVVANHDQTSASVRELLLLQGQIIQGLSAQIETLSRTALLEEIKDINAPKEQVIYELRPARLLKLRHRL